MIWQPYLFIPKIPKHLKITFQLPFTIVGLKVVSSSFVLPHIWTAESLNLKYKRLAETVKIRYSRKYSHAYRFQAWGKEPRLSAKADSKKRTERGVEEVSAIQRAFGNRISGVKTTYLEKCLRQIRALF